MKRYYYNPVTKRFYSSIISARNWALINSAADRSLSVLRHLRAEHWSYLNSDEWCTSHPDIVSSWLGLIPTSTRSILEVKLHMWFYRYIKRAAKAYV